MLPRGPTETVRRGKYNQRMICSWKATGLSVSQVCGGHRGGGSTEASGGNGKEKPMLIYEYRCEKCGQVNEFLILGKQEQLHCKQCGSEDLTKLLSAHNTSSSSSQEFAEPSAGGCCGTPHSCGTPGKCCSG